MLWEERDHWTWSPPCSFTHYCSWHDNWVSGPHLCITTSVWASEAPDEYECSLQRWIRAQTHHLISTFLTHAEHEGAAAAKGRENATTPICSLCCIPRMETYRREDLEVIWPAPPKPSTQRAASGTRTVRASLRLHVSSQLCVHIGEPRPSQSSSSRLIHGCDAGLRTEMLPRWSVGASPCFYCLEDRKEAEVSLCWRRKE